MEDVWSKLRVLLALPDDNMTAPHVVNGLKSTSSAVNLIAREIALEHGDSAFRPGRRSH